MKGKTRVIQFSNGYIWMDTSVDNLCIMITSKLAMITNKQTIVVIKLDYKFHRQVQSLRMGKDREFRLKTVWGEAHHLANISKMSLTKPMPSKG